MNILSRDDLPLGGFNGLKEHRLITDSKAFGSHRNASAWEGIGSFVYLADARFLPHGETGMHGHTEVDVISVMVEGQISHAGSLEHGTKLNAGDVQVQRAGGEGFKHNEINPNSLENRMIQLWVLPEMAGEKAGYKLYQPRQEGVTAIYGGNKNQLDTFVSDTQIDIVRLPSGGEYQQPNEALVYVITGELVVAGEGVKDGDLIRGKGLGFMSNSSSQLIVIYNK